MSAGYLSNLLIKNHADFEAEKTEVYLSGLESSPWQHFDQTAARVGGVNHTTNVICNPLYTVYLTTPKKDRLTVLKGLQNTWGGDREGYEIDSIRVPARTPC
jgi:hypothetical protein